MELETGATVVLFMHGHAHEASRTMRYDGTRATLRGIFRYGLGDCIEIHDHLTGGVERIIPSQPPAGTVVATRGSWPPFCKRSETAGGHGSPAGGTAMTTARESLESHLMAFAAEHARLTGSTFGMATFSRQADVVTASYS